MRDRSSRTDDSMRIPEDAGEDQGLARNSVITWHGTGGRGTLVGNP